VLLVEDPLEPIARFDGMVQTLGLAVGDDTKEMALTLAGGRNGVDRIVKLGRMHIFGSPWGRRQRRLITRFTMRRLAP
jgi:hypothetical protein